MQTCPAASVKSRLVLPFWYRLTWVVLEKGPLNGCARVCVCYSLSLLNTYGVWLIVSYCGERTGRRLLWSTTLSFLTLLSDSHISISLIIHGLWWTAFQTGQGPCRANLHKWGLAQSPSCDCGQRRTVNHIVDTCPFKICRQTESTPRSGWWHSHMAGIYSDCSTREILIVSGHRQHFCAASLA